MWIKINDTHGGKVMLRLESIFMIGRPYYSASVGQWALSIGVAEIERVNHYAKTSEEANKFYNDLCDKLGVEDVDRN